MRTRIFTPEQALARKRSRAMLWRRTRRQQTRTGEVHPVEIVRPPEHVLAERAHRRGLLPNTLTNACFGDPLPGYSALDRKRR